MNLDNKLEGYLAHGATWAEFVGERSTADAAQELVDYIIAQGNEPPASAGTIEKFLDDQISE